MSTKKGYTLIVLVLLALVATPVRGDISADQVRKSIRGGVGYLKKYQKVNGSWTDHPGYPGGLTALCSLAMINAGVPVSDPSIQRALKFVRSLGKPRMVYSTSLITMFLCAAEPDEDASLIRVNVNWLERIQIKTSLHKGSWAYSERNTAGDNSNSQFALLALHEAERAGVKVKESTWQSARDYWLRMQKEDGSWGYVKGEPSTGSMTCAGIASLLITSGRVHQGDAKVQAGTVHCCGTQSDDEPLRRALNWLGAKFSVERNPNPYSGLRANLNTTHLYYYLYGVERVGRLSGNRFIGRHDWFREGAAFLVDGQDSLSGFWRGDYHAEQNALVATSFALLFLAKGRRPILITQLKHGRGGGWNPHRSSVKNLTRRMEQRWRRDLTWQTIDARAATVDDLLETPVLFISGRDSLELSSDQKNNLREYINQGGFIFAEACCGGEGFDRSFKALMKELFKDSSLQLLPPEHPVWYAEEKVDPDYLRPLYGVDACCRTSIIYCPQDLSCFWELNRPGRDSSYPANVQAEIEACVRIGENVVTYATNRELKNKLDRPQFTLNRNAPEQPERGVLYIPKLMYAGGGDEAPNALPNLLNVFREKAQMRVGVENRKVLATDPSLFTYPLLFMHGRRAFRLTSAERSALALFIERGGVIVADSICASPEFSTAFRREFSAIFPAQKLARIPTGHPLFTRDFGGYDLNQLTLRDPQMRAGDDPLTAHLKKVSPLLEGLQIDDRISVVFSPYDISCALENGSSLQCKGYVKGDAARLAINIILFALQQ
ncbi:MAG TPA: DUF4159 domain-containing protein [Pirellulaceae bacterium]|jgi:hypothetical protein|nr:DUF4159 domain-containing protein [Pirellulaceae bacterium]